MTKSRKSKKIQKYKLKNNQKSRKIKKIKGGQVNNSDIIIYALDNDDGLVRGIIPQSFCMIDEDHKEHTYKYDEIVINDIKLSLTNNRMKISGFISDKPFDMTLKSITPIDHPFFERKLYDLDNSYFVGGIYTKITGNIEAREKEAERIEAERIKAQRIEDDRLKAEKEAQRLKAETEAQRLKAETEAQRKEAESAALSQREALRAAERKEALREAAERKEAQRIEAEKEAQRIEDERLKAEKEEDKKAIAEGRIPDRIKGSDNRIKWAKENLGWIYNQRVSNQGQESYTKSEPKPQIKPEPNPDLPGFSGDPWYRTH